MVGRCRQLSKTGLLLFVVLSRHGLFGMQGFQQFALQDQQKFAQTENFLRQGMAAYETVTKTAAEVKPETLMEMAKNAGNAFKKVVDNSLSHGFDLRQKQYVSHPIEAYKKLCGLASYNLATLYNAGLFIPLLDTQESYVSHYLNLAAQCHYEQAVWALACINGNNNAENCIAEEIDHKKFLEAEQFLQSEDGHSIENIEQVCEAYETIFDFYQKLGSAAHVYDEYLLRSQNVVWNVFSCYVAVSGFEKIPSFLVYKGVFALLNDHAKGGDHIACSLLGVILSRRGESEKAIPYLEKGLPYALSSYIVQVHLLYCLLQKPGESIDRPYQLFLSLLDNHDAACYLVSNCPAAVKKELKQLSEKNEPRASFMLGVLIVDKSRSAALKLIKSAADKNECQAAKWLVYRFIAGQGVKKSIDEAICYALKALQSPSITQQESDKIAEALFSATMDCKEDKAKIVIAIVRQWQTIPFLKSWLKSFKRGSINETVAFLLYLEVQYGRVLQQGVERGNPMANLWLASTCITKSSQEKNPSRQSELFFRGLQHGEVAYKAGLLTQEEYGVELLGGGQILKARGERVKARSYFQDALKQGNDQAKRELAIMGIEDARATPATIEGALATIEQSAMEGDQDAIQFMARIYCRDCRFISWTPHNGTPAKAYYLVNKFLQIKPQSKRGGYFMAHLMDRYGGEPGVEYDAQRAYELLLRVKDCVFFTKDDYALLGVFSCFLGRDKEALSWFEKVPQFVLAPWYRALIYFRDGRLSAESTEDACREQIIAEMQKAVSFIKAISFINEKFTFPKQVMSQPWRSLVDYVVQWTQQTHDPRGVAIVTRMAFALSPVKVCYTDDCAALKDLHYAVGCNNVLAKNFLAYLSAVGCWTEKSVPQAIHYLVNVLLDSNGSESYVNETADLLKYVINEHFKKDQIGDYEGAIVLAQEVYDTVKQLFSTENTVKRRIAYDLLGGIEQAFIINFCAAAEVVSRVDYSGLFDVLRDLAKKGSKEAAATLLLCHGLRFIRMLEAGGKTFEEVIDLYEKTESLNKNEELTPFIRDAVSKVVILYLEYLANFRKYSEKNTHLIKFVQRQCHGLGEKINEEIQRLIALQKTKEAKERKKGVAQLMQLASRGCGSASFDLSKMIFEGCDLKKSKSDGFFYLATAICSGNRHALVFLTQLFLNNRENENMMKEIKAVISTVQIDREAFKEEEFSLVLNGLRALDCGNYAEALSLFDEHFKKFDKMVAGILYTYTLMAKPDRDYDAIYNCLALLVRRKGFCDWMVALPLLTNVLQKAIAYLKVSTRLQDKKAIENLPKVEKLWAEHQEFVTKVSCSE